MFAPVVIWTLNRYEHLRRCIESLAQNSCAGDTEIFISVDYPPEEKYVEGYLKIKNYLDQGITGFKRVHVFYQEKNLGSILNYQFIMNEAYQKFDRIIISEDDNEFSPYFLQFMNTLLHKYENDNTIFAVSGYSYPVQWKEDGNDIVKIDNIFPAYGSGFWREKYEAMLNGISNKALEKVMKDFRMVYKIYKRHPANFCNLVWSYFNNDGIMCDKKGGFAPIDSAMGIYMVANNKCVIMPKLSQTVNHGFDGSGEHCQVNKLAELNNNIIVENWKKAIHIKTDADVPVYLQNTNVLAEVVPYQKRDVYSSWVQYVLYRLRLKKICKEK